jgi:hypothetical protein
VAEFPCRKFGLIDVAAVDGALEAAMRRTLRRHEHKFA